MDEDSDLEEHHNVFDDETAGITPMPDDGDGIDALPAGLPPSSGPLAEATWTRLGAVGQSWLQRVERVPGPTLGNREAAAACGLVCPRCHGLRYLSKRTSQGGFEFEAVPCDVCNANAAPPSSSPLAPSDSGLTDWPALAAWTFEHLPISPAAPTAEVIQAARDYAAAPHGWFVLAGTDRGLRNHLAAAIANEVQVHYGQTVFASAPLFLKALQEGMAARRKPRRDNERTRLLQSWSRVVPTADDPSPPMSQPPPVSSPDQVLAVVRDCLLLVLVDLDRVRWTPWAQERVYIVINHRYNLGQPTVVTMTTTDGDSAHIEPRTLSRLLDWQHLFGDQVYFLNTSPTPEPAPRQRRHFRLTEQ